MSVLRGLSEEDQLRGDAVRALVDTHFRPLEEEIDRTDQVDPGVLRDLRHRARGVGSLGFNLPEHLGGGGLDYRGQCVIGVEMGRVTTVLAEQVGQLPDSLRHVNDDQRRWLLDPLLRGDTSIAYALTEPGGGSDLAAARCRAEPDGDEWVISGSKQFISNAGVADTILVLAVTEAAAPLRDRFTVFAVPADADGLVVTERYRTLGWRGHHLNALAFDACRVGDAAVLGRVGEGFEVMMTTVNGARLNVACRCLGAAELALRHAVRYAAQRPVAAGLLSDLGMSQQKIADMDTDVRASAALISEAAVLGDAGDAEFRVAVARAKLYASEAAGRVTDSALQLLGGAGYTTDHPVERLLRDVRGYRIGEGTSEIQRVQIARAAVRRDFGGR